MKLNIEERLTLMQVLPERGNFETMDTVDKLLSTLKLKEEEVKKYKFREEQGRAYWDLSGNERVELPVSKMGESFLIKCLERLDKEEKLTPQMFQIFKRFRDLD